MRGVAEREKMMEVGKERRQVGGQRKEGARVVEDMVVA